MLIDVRVTGPRVAVRWAASVNDASRVEFERRYSLENGRRDGGPEWRYELGDRSRENIGALVRDPAVTDTGYIDRTQFTVEEPETTVGVRPLPFPLSTDNEFQSLGDLFQTRASACCWRAAGCYGRHAGRASPPARGVAALLGVTLAAYALPLPRGLHMGDADTYTSNRDSFESYAGVRAIRFEAHLSHAILGRLYDVLGQGDTAPREALTC